MRAIRERAGQGEARGGFTLVELLVVIAIIGIIAAILIPNLLDALQRAKQRRTMSDVRNAGNVWMSWLTDNLSAAAAGSQQATFDWSDFSAANYNDLHQLLVPQYTAELPLRDGWQREYEFGQAGSLEAPRPIAIRSRGADGLWDTGTYTVGPFIATDYFQDIVWSGGFFVRWPEGQLDD